MPGSRTLLLSLCIPLGAAGCASQPVSDAEYAETAYKVELAAGSFETEEPATLPVEPELQGAHPLDVYVQTALDRNPEILAARRAVAAQVEDIPQVTALDDPMLVDSFQPITNNSVETAAGRGPNMLSLSQKFPWFGKLRLRGEVAEQEAQMALARLAQAQLEVIEDVHIAWYELYFHQRAIRITETNRRLLEDLLQIAQARYRAGETSQQDVLRAQLELDRIEDRLIDLRKRLQVARADLAELIHTSPEAELDVPDNPEIPSAPEQIERLYEAAARCRPELRERLYAIIRDQRSEELARLQYYPDVTAGVGWQAITTDDALSPVADGNDNVSFSLGLNLPVWQDKLRAGVREAEHRAVESARRYDAARDDTFRLIRRYTVQARALEEQITLFRESIIPDAEQTLEVSMADYRVGSVDFQQMIDNWQQLLTFEIQLARLEASLGQRLASLERVVGCRLSALPAASSEGPGNPNPPESSPAPDEAEVPEPPKPRPEPE